MSSESLQATHGVQFYETADFLCDRVADFLAEGLRGGESLVVVAISARENLLSRRLLERGFDVDSAIRARRLAFFEARATLDRIMVGSRPDWSRFEDVIGSAMRSAAAASSNGHVCAYGEMVDILQSEGNSEGAIELEEMWNRLQETEAFALLCGYVLSQSYEDREIQKICESHGHVFPLNDGLDEIRAPCSGSHRALVAEIARRAQVEATLRGSIRDLRRIEADLRRSQQETERLARITGAIADAVSPEQISESIVDGVAATIGASSASLWTVSDGNAVLMRSLGFDEAAKQAFGSFPLAPPSSAPVVDALLRGLPIWIDSQEELLLRYPRLAKDITSARVYRIVSLPLSTRGVTRGALCFTFDDAPPLDADAKRFLNLVAKHSAQALERLRVLAELNETVRFNQMFTGILGHDLRNPLGAIMSSAQVAQRRDTQGKLARPISRILRSGARMARMIDQLLDFTRVRVGTGIPLQLGSTDLASLIETTIEELEGVHPESSFDLATAGDTRGNWDADRLCQVFSNLIANATLHGAQSEGVSVRIDASSRDYVSVSVHNGGVIPPELVPRIFEPLGEAGLRGERSSGLGLGLFISREITKAHGGSIDIYSTAEDGTTFVVSLPRSVATRDPRL